MILKRWVSFQHFTLQQTFYYIKNQVSNQLYTHTVQNILGAINSQNTKRICPLFLTCCGCHSGGVSARDKPGVFFLAVLFIIFIGGCSTFVIKQHSLQCNSDTSSNVYRDDAAMVLLTGCI